MFDYFTRISIINWKEFTVDSILVHNRILPLDHKNTVYTVSMNTHQWQRLSWKTEYSVILANNTKWVPSQLFGYGMAKLGTLGRGQCHNLISVTGLLLVWPVGHMDPHKQSQVPRTGNLSSWMWHLKLLSHF